MNKTLFTVLSYLGVAIVIPLCVYVFPLPRKATLQLLTSEENAPSGTTLKVVSGAEAAATSALTPVDTSTSTDYQPQPIYEYKLLMNVDPCTMSKLGAQGWNASQFGGTIVGVPGKDSDCSGSSYFNVSGFDWVLFVRTHTPVPSQ